MEIVLLLSRGDLELHMSLYLPPEWDAGGTARICMWRLRLGGERSKNRERGGPTWETDTKASSGAGPRSELLSLQRKSETLAVPAAIDRWRQFERSKRGTPKRAEFEIIGFVGKGKPDAPNNGKRATTLGVSSKSFDEGIKSGRKCCAQGKSKMSHPTN